MNDTLSVGSGLCVESLRIAAVTAATCNGDIRFTSLPVPACDVPPAVLMPQLAGEPLRFDSTNPLHPRGAGGVWPPGADTIDVGSGPRFPIALAWTALNRTASLRWRWKTPSGDLREASPAEAIATVVAAVSTADADLQQELVLVVPNQLRMERQQELIDSCRRQARKVRLLWRPVAAALTWCENYGDEVLRSHSDMTGRVGRLLCLHFGLEEFEITSLDLVIETREDKRWLLPARPRPDSTCGTFPSFGLEAIAQKLAPESWPSLWLTSSLEDVVRSLDESRNETASEPQKSSSSTIFCNGAGRSEWLPATTTPADFRRWLSAAITQSSDLIGAVVTGELARCQFDKQASFRQIVFNALPSAAARTRILVEARADCMPDTLARGAAIHALRLARNEPSYLDTLPHIRTATYIDGKLAWLDLLKSDDSYVDGGRTWRRPEPLSGLKVQAGRHRVEITLWHDEFPTVRKIGAEFAQPVSEDVPVNLEVRIDPAQGNARVDVVPTVTNAGVRRLQLEWRHMQDEKLSPEEWLRRQPTLFPAVLRRTCSRARWNSVKLAMEGYLSGQTPRALTRILERLKQTDLPAYPEPDVEARATAVSSDGDPPHGEAATLDLFVTHALSRLKTARGEAKDKLVRALGYASTKHPDFQRFLTERIATAGSRMEDYELIACGRCLRDSASIAAFAAAFLDRLRKDPTALNYWLKAFGEMLRYRVDGTRDIKSNTCEDLTSHVFKVFEQERLEGKAKFLFRNSALCIVYLLRRRAYDDDYLRPGSALNTKVREAFQEAIRDVKKGELKVIGGAIRLDRVLQTMIDYIDRKGTPGLTWDEGLQALTN